MRLKRQEPGIIVSGVAHAALLVAGLVALSSAPPFATQEEAVAVEVISETELRAITKGEKTAKEVQPEPKPRVDKVAEIKDETPDQGEAKRDVPAPPSRPRDVEEADEQVSAPPQQQQKQEPAKPSEEVAKAEPEKAEEKIPDPPRRPVAEKTPERQKPAEEKVEGKLESRQLAKMIDDTKRAEKPKAKPAEPDRKFNVADIRQLLETKEKPQSTGSKGKELNRTAALGTATSNAPKMSASQRDGLNDLVRSQIDKCWTRPPPGGVLDFKLHVVMALKPDGALVARPEVVNSSPDPAFSSWASSLTRAILRCSPFKIPAQYDPFYADWRDWNVLFDPKDFQG